MANTCGNCGGDISPPAYDCNYCNLILCSDCRLPESHNCAGLSVTRTDKDDKPESADISHDLPGTSREPDKDRSPSVTTKRELGNRDDGLDWSRISEGDSKSTIQRISSWLGFIVLSPFLLIRWIWGQFLRLLTALVKFPATLLTSPQFWIGILLVGGVAVVLGPGPSVIGDTLQDASESADDAISTGSGALADDDVNTTRVEHEVHARINEIRSERGLQPLRHDPELQDIARGHSQSMATNDYLAHEAPDGDTFEDRYQQAGYDCRVSTGSNRYTTGGENVAYTYASSDIDADYGDTVNYNGNETKIARGIVSGWMNSPSHRENLLQPYWENEGIGVAVSETDGKKKVYATQNFC